MHPAPALACDGLATCSILSLRLVTGHCRWPGGRRKRGRKLPLTLSASKQALLYLSIHKANRTYLSVMRYFKPRSLAPAASDSEGTAHSSRLPTRPRRRQREELGGPQDLCHLAGSWHGDTDTNLLSLVLLQPGQVGPAVSAPCRDLTCSSPPLPKQGRIRPRGSCQRHLPLPPPPAQLQRGAVGGGNEAAKSVERGTEPGHK